MQLGVSQLCSIKMCRIQITSFYENSGDHYHLCHCKAGLTLLQSQHLINIKWMCWADNFYTDKEQNLVCCDIVIAYLASAQNAHFDEGRN